MDKRQIFFQIYLNPEDIRDQKIISWLEGIPKWHRSRKVKKILFESIVGVSGPSQELIQKETSSLKNPKEGQSMNDSSRKATHFARKLFHSLPGTPSQSIDSDL